MARERSKNELRCFCNRKPLLAVYGLDKRGNLYVHVKVWKQTRLFAEIIVTGGVVELTCRECLRWQRVVIRQPNRMSLEEQDAPLVIASHP